MQQSTLSSRHMGFMSPVQVWIALTENNESSRWAHAPRLPD